MNRRVLLIGALLVIPGLVFLAISLTNDPRQIDSPLIGKPAPTFVLADIDGTVVGLDDLRGKPVVLNFWATWCIPCIAEHPILVDSALRHRGEAHYVGVIYNDEVPNIRKYLAQRGAWGYSLQDEESKAAIAYGVFGVPETFIIDRDGVVVDKVTGGLSSSFLEQRLQELM